MRWKTMAWRQRLLSLAKAVHLKPALKLLLLRIYEVAYF